MSQDEARKDPISDKWPWGKLELKDLAVVGPVILSTFAFAYMLLATFMPST
jgi:hypothetical protein